MSFSPVVGSNLPHDWITPVAEGELMEGRDIEGRDIVWQFHPDQLLESARNMPEPIMGQCPLLQRVDLEES